MKILAIETSCDETAIALLDIQGSLEAPEIKVLANALYSQAKLHEAYGGVYPNLAKREHTKNLPILLEKVCNTECCTNIDFIAVTNGPGLEPALWTGITFAEELGKKWGKPVLSINHMEGHIYSVLMNAGTKLEFPALALLVSGGHTEIVYIENYGKYKILGRTRDDAVGEAFDKVARMLGLPYPGGPHISALAESARKKAEQTQKNAEKIQHGSASSLRESAGKLEFPRPMIHSDNLDFSFSGLKTAVLYYIKSAGELTQDGKEDIARAFEDSAIEVLISKTKRAIADTDTRSLIVAGGVSANKHLISEVEKLKESYPHLNTHIPEKELSTDNAVMIGISAYVKVSIDPTVLEKQIEIKATGNLEIDSPL